MHLSSYVEKGDLVVSYDTEKYKVWKLPNLLLLHWVLNPGIAFNEIILGQRIPAVTLIDKTSNAPLMDRQYIPCPACGEIHSAKLWAKGNAFGHWLGYICPSCKGKIPCLWNVTSLALLVVLAPVWFPLKLIFEKKYLDFEISRFAKQKSDIETPPSKFLWLKMGVLFSFFMFVFFLFQSHADSGMSLEEIVMIGAICLFGGALFSGFMWIFLGRKKQNITSR
jgi:hypothetical protein